ncbi:MAG: prepilin-type N-terminal cleavage/methylation domain-containing protein [Planctomycetes bacterium]|nr:prepilin-type N-terminal cleavage/methylation domain-containing protein [Planctomycetota bacterium]
MQTTRYQRHRGAVFSGRPDTTSAGSRRGAADRRPGFTLFEIVIVLAVIVVAIGITYPAISAIQSEYQMRQSGMLVQAKLAAARVHAIETGYDYQFCFEPGGHRFLVVPYDLGALTAEQSSGGKVSYKAGGKLVTDKAHFVAPTAAGGHQVAPELMNGLRNAADYTGVSWALPIIFHPDGSASAAEIQIEDNKSRRLTVSVRPLTGAVTVSKVQSGAK